MLLGISLILVFLSLVCAMLVYVFAMEHRCNHKTKVWYGYVDKQGRTHCVYKCPICGGKKEELR